MTLKQLLEIIESNIDLWGNNEIGVKDSDGNYAKISGLLNTQFNSFFTIEQEALEGEIIDTEPDPRDLDEIHRAYHQEALGDFFNEK